MMKQPDQQLHDEIFKRALSLGLSVFEFLPKEGTKYPFVVIGDTHILPNVTKTRVYGRCTTTLHIWADSRNRKQVSDMIGQLMAEISKIKQIDRTQWSMMMSESDSQILKDNSTTENLYHGLLHIYFRFF